MIARSTRDSSIQAERIGLALGGEFVVQGTFVEHCLAELILWNPLCYRQAGQEAKKEQPGRGHVAAAHVSTRNSSCNRSLRCAPLLKWTMSPSFLSTPWSMDPISCPGGSCVCLPRGGACAPPGKSGRDTPARPPFAPPSVFRHTGWVGYLSIWKGVVDVGRFPVDKDEEGEPSHASRWKMRGRGRHQLREGEEAMTHGCERHPFQSRPGHPWKSQESSLLSLVTLVKPYGWDLSRPEQARRSIPRPHPEASWSPRSVRPLDRDLTKTWECSLPFLFDVAGP